MASIAKVAAAGKLSIPQVCSTAIVMKRHKTYGLSQYNYKRGSGGRSSFSGIVATVFGGTGMLGHAVINKLDFVRKSNHRFILHRVKSDLSMHTRLIGKTGCQVIVPYRCEPYGIKHIPLMGDLGQILFNKFDLRDDNSMKKVMQYSNVVINLIGREHETRNYSFRDIYVDGPRRMARFAREAGVDRFIHISHLNAPVRSSNLYKDGSKYLQAKLEGEAAVLEEFPDATIVRPSDITAQNGGWLVLYADAYMSVTKRRTRSLLRRPEFPLWKWGREVYKIPVRITDFSKGIEAIVWNEETKGKLYQFAGPEGYPISDLLAYINGCKVAYDYTTTSDFTELRRKTARNNMRYKLTGLGVPVLSTDRLERETISDHFDYNLLSLRDLGIQPESVLPYIEYLLRPSTNRGKLVLIYGQVPEPPMPQAVFLTEKPGILLSSKLYTV